MKSLSLKPRSSGRLLIPASVLIALSLDAQALQINALVTDNGSSFHYDVSVLNDDPIDDLLVVSLDDAPLSDPLIGSSLTAPAGFLASYDPGLGIVDLLSDTAGFVAGLTIGPFSFDSTAGPGQAFTRYTALNLNGDVFVGNVVSRVVGAGEVPVPATLALMLGGLGMLSYSHLKSRTGTSA